MRFQFRKRKTETLYTFELVSGHQCDNSLECEEEYLRAKQGLMGYRQTLMGAELNSLLSLGEYLAAQKDKYVLIRFSPELQSFCTVDSSAMVNWRYLVLANDFEGLGVDKGFVKTESPYALYSPHSLYDVQYLSEDVLEEEYSNITIFGLNRNSKERLRDFLHTDKTPFIQTLLSGNELFINIVCGKAYGFFNSFLAKSRVDLQEEINEFENVTDAAN